MRTPSTTAGKAGDRRRQVAGRTGAEGPWCHGSFVPNFLVSASAILAVMGRPVASSIQAHCPLGFTSRNQVRPSGQTIKSSAPKRSRSACTFRAAQPLPEEDLARRVEVRLARQQLLTRRLPAPPQLDVIVGEAALLRSTAERTAMTEQLEQLLRLARLPNLSLRVLPLAASLRCAPDAMFEILEFPKSRTGQAEPPVVYSDSLTGAIYLDHPDEVAAYDEVWRRTTEAALTGDDSDKFITSMIERYRDA